MRWDSVMELGRDRLVGCFLALGFLLAFSACEPATLTEVQDDVFTRRCSFDSCHDADGPVRGLDLSAGNSFESMVGVEADEPGYTLVVPESPEQSLVFIILRQDIYGDGPTEPSVRQMPPSSPLRDSEIELVESWIADGAPDN